MEKLPCRKCGVLVLPATIEKTNVYCMPCFKGHDKRDFLQRAEDIAVRMEVMKDSDRVAGAGTLARARFPVLRPRGERGQSSD